MTSSLMVEILDNTQPHSRQTFSTTVPSTRTKRCELDFRDIITHTRNVQILDVSWLHAEIQGKPRIQQFCLRSTVGQGLPFK
jgi:hypothetical protein